MNNSGESLETAAVDSVFGDLTLVTDAVLGELLAEEETELASFDGALRLRIPEGAVAETVPLCIASTAGPPVIFGDAVSLGRLHTILPSAEGNPLRQPVLLALRFDESIPIEQLEVRHQDPASGDFVPLRGTPSPVEGEILAELEELGVVGLFRVGG